MAGPSPFQFPQPGASNPSPFGAQPSASQAPSAAAATTAPTSGGLFGSAGNTSGLFGGAASGTPPPMFGALSGTENRNPQDRPAGSTLFGTATPAAQKSLFPNTASTTPSATPPTSGTQPKSLFAGAAGGSSSGGGLFAQLKTSDAPASTPTMSFGTPAASNAPKPLGALASNAPQPSAQKTLFGTPTATPAATPTTTLFGQGAASSAAPQPPTTATNLFGQGAASTAASQPSMTAPSLFGKAGTSTPASQPLATASLFAQAPATTAASQPSATAQSAAPTLKLGATTGAMSTASLFKTAPPASAAAPASSSPKTTTKSLFAQPVPAQASTTQATPALQSSTQFGTSSTNQPASARLKNKSMDEILTRWATDLAKHQKEFQKQAMQVAEWDRILVDNTDKIGKLLAKTFQAERDASEVEKQLAGVESQQEELDQYLDRYEKEVDDMIQKHGMTQDTAGLDIERERTYKLAEKLTDRLDDLNKDLTDVIEEINRASSLLSNTNGTDDPLSRVVRVLNSHLSQLQKIDIDAAQLQSKVDDAQKQTRTMGGGDWRIGSDPTEEFYKSFSRR